MDRASDFESVRRGFESLQAHQVCIRKKFSAVEVVWGNMPVVCLQDSKGRTESLDEGVRVSAASKARRRNESLQAHQACILVSGPLAQLVEHLTLNQGVTGSIPVRLTIFARVAELADALDLGSSGVIPIGVQVPSLAPEKIQILE